MFTVRKRLPSGWELSNCLRPRGLIRGPGVIILAEKFGFLRNQGGVSALDQLNRPISAPRAGTLEAPLVGRFFFVHLRHERL